MNKLEDADVIEICGEEESYMWFSERAENRLAWILTGAVILATLPVFILAFLM